MKSHIPEEAWSLIPEHCRYGLRDYIEHGRPVGGFLTAILENKLVESCHRADSTNIKAIVGYASFLYAYAPRECWGSHANIMAWMAHDGLDNLLEPTDMPQQPPERDAS